VALVLVSHETIRIVRERGERDRDRMIEDCMSLRVSQH